MTDTNPSTSTSTSTHASTPDQASETPLSAPAQKPPLPRPAVSMREEWFIVFDGKITPEYTFPTQEAVRGYIDQTLEEGAEDRYGLAMRHVITTITPLTEIPR